MGEAERGERMWGEEGGDLRLLENDRTRECRRQGAEPGPQFTGLRRRKETKEVQRGTQGQGQGLGQTGGFRVTGT